MILATSTPSRSSRTIRSAAASFYRSARFCLAQAANLHDVPERRRDFEGYCYSAFYLLEEAERHRHDGSYTRNARGFAREQTDRYAAQRGSKR